LKKNILIGLTIFFWRIGIIFGALPPLYQSTNDLSNIAEILSGQSNSSLWVSSVDLKNLTATMQVSGNKTCKFLFQRKKESHPGGWAGPAAPLEIKSTNCR
jgi:hypothetical protein